MEIEITEEKGQEGTTAVKLLSLLWGRELRRILEDDGSRGGGGGGGHFLRREGNFWSRFDAIEARGRLLWAKAIM